MSIKFSLLWNLSLDEFVGCHALFDNVCSKWKLELHAHPIKILQHNNDIIPANLPHDWRSEVPINTFRYPLDGSELSDAYVNPNSENSG